MDLGGEGKRAKSARGGRWVSELVFNGRGVVAFEIICPTRYNSTYSPIQSFLVVVVSLLWCSAGCPRTLRTPGKIRYDRARNDKDAEISRIWASRLLDNHRAFLVAH
jgi:hypothetical protein